MATKIKISTRREYREQLRIFLSLSKNLNAKLKRLFRKVGRKAAKKHSQGFFVDDIMFMEFGDELYKLLSSHYRLVIKQTQQRLIKIRTKQEKDPDEIIQEFIDNNTAQKVTQISETTRILLSATIAQGIADGLGSQDLAKLITRSIAFADYRATMISRTETHTAQNFAHVTITRVMEFKNPVKVWVNAMDSRSRTWHMAMNGKQVAQNEKFEVNTPKVGVVLMDYCGDPSGGASNVINCRCMTQTYDEEDEILV